MKNLYLILALFFIIPSQMQGNFENSKPEATIQITNDLMICKSYFEQIHDKPVHYAKPLKVGFNSHYFVPFNGMGVTIEIIKYE